MQGVPSLNNTAASLNVGKWAIEAKLDEYGELVLGVTDQETRKTSKAEFGANAKLRQETKALAIVEESPYTTFSIVKKPVKDQFNNNVGFKTIIQFNNRDEAQIFYNWGVFDCGSIYKNPPTVKVDYLFQKRDSVISCYQQNLDETVLIELMAYIDEHYGPYIKKMENLINNEKSIDFKNLWYLFKEKTKAWGYADGSKIGGEIRSWTYVAGIYPQFYLDVTVIKSAGRALEVTVESMTIPAYSGLRTLESLPIHKLEEGSEVYNELVARGRQFLKYAVGVHHKQYNGYVLQKDNLSSFQLYKASGRVMIDAVNFNKFEANSALRSSNSMYYYDEDEDTTIEDVPEDHIYMCWHGLLGFSLAAKKWGEFQVTGVSEVEWDDRAFERLVIPEEQKSLVKALVATQNLLEFDDFITGKGRGCIFLLHGTPGVGKTLTAESIAEYLHRPLYAIQIGELGMDVNELEKKLRDIFEVSTSWNATILLDEADVFLEKRTDNNVIRNAMVGVFLKMLEYYQGVLFLTTNRVKCFDKSFHSRISVALRYDDLDVDSRERIWVNMMDAAGIHGVKTSEMRNFDLNGRQIRTIARLSLSLALSEKEPVSLSHLQRTVKHTTDFKLDMRELLGDTD